MWKKNFGGSGEDLYRSVTAAPDGLVAVGESQSSSFGGGDWEGVEGKGGEDAIIVKYDHSGNGVWKKHLGGGDDDYFESVTAAPDGFVAVGFSFPYSFGSGDWAGIAGKGWLDAIIVKYDHSGNLVWKKNFGGSDDDYYYSVTAAPDGFVAVGYSWPNSFGGGDWTGVESKGWYDAIIVKYAIAEPQDTLYGDVNGDTKLDIADLTALREYFATREEDKPTPNPGADINGNGEVEINDLTAFRKYFATPDEDKPTLPWK
jgi:hypothetical protein